MFSSYLFYYFTYNISLSTLIQIPNATFILTYLGGCAAGIILLKDNKFGIVISAISLILTGIIFLFLNWTLLYPLIITLIWFLFMLKSKKLKF